MTIKLACTQEVWYYDSVGDKSRLKINQVEIKMTKVNATVDMKAVVDTIMSNSKKVKVKFTKADGTKRTMICAKADVPSRSKAVALVVECSTDALRSFRYDSVEEILPVE